MSKVAVVTGASKGIGAATALAFGKAGYDVVVNYKTDTTSAEAIVKEIEGYGQKAVAVQSNAFTEDGIKELFKVVKDTFSKIDVLVNNAGNPNEPSFGEYTCDDVNKSLGANFGATVLCTQEAVKLMDEGSILFTSSIYGLPFGGNPGLALYSAGKAAMINFAQTMSEKLAPKIRCNVVAPGTTRTPTWDGVAQEYIDKSLDMTLMKQWVESDEIADSFVFLAEAPHITGQTIVVDAGWQKKIRDTSSKRR
jgi:NAD(P)-dependent dehydrogenase (short-subunit alcohol dehydrogenase family)